LFIFLIFILIQTDTLAQVTFTNKTDELINSPGRSGVALAVIDMNDDGLDDIVRLDEASDLYVEYQSQDGSVFETLTFGSITSSNQWSMCIGDVDNNGTNEILSGGAYNGLTLVNSGMNGDTSMIGELPQSGSVFVQGSNFVDINNDGFLDVFACHDDGASYIWENDGAGNFEVNTDWIDLSINGSLGENASGNYGSIWSDIDSDGDLDLYIAKCRQGVTDTADDRRINKLYVNDGNGNYTEESEARGLAIGWQSWTADMQDINNDGFLDVFVTNHDHQSQLLLNDGTGNFTELSNTGIDVSGLPIQGVMRDFDNDGWVDVLVAGSTSQLFLNNRDNTFTEIVDAFATGGMQSYALGDLNNDGYVDVFGGYANGFNNPSSEQDRVWINGGGDNNYLAVSLKGQISNQNGVGAWVEIYGEWGMQVREVRSGESYGIMNSTTQYFGIEQAETIDSIIVKWPSGLTQLEYNVSINSKVIILEGGCLAAAPEITILGNTTFCSGDSIVLSVPDEYVTYKWSNGENTASTTIYEAGIYSLVSENEEGCTAFSEAIIVEVDPQLDPMISSLGAEIFCEGGEVVLSVADLDGDYPLIWTSGEVEQSITVEESGIYSVSAQGLCGSFESNSIEVTVLEYPGAPIAEGDSILEGEIAVLTAIGDNIAWYANETDDNHIALGNTFEVAGLIVNTSFYASDRNGDAGFSANVGMLDHGGSEYSGVANSNNLLIFDALDDFRLDSVKVYTDIPGIRKMLLVDEDLNEISSVFIDVPEGENFIYVGLDVPAGENMSLTTNAETNEQNIGITGPRLQRSSDNVDYPYIVDDIVRIKDSNYGGDYYYYFYDWQISTGSSACLSEKTKVDVVLEEPNALVELTDGQDISIFPNPSNGMININVESYVMLPITVSLYTLDGKLVENRTVVSQKGLIDFSNTPNGLYILEIKNKDSIMNKKVIISE
ncbi:MAG: hypothetical protein ACI86M_004055, partial [Saprospiraceae bacterium]